MDGAASIGAVEAAILEQAVAGGWRSPPVPARRSGRAAAVIGAGPAGLACAERLSVAGWTASAYDRNSEIGGLLATGAPPFKLDKSLLARRRDWLAAAGVDFRLGVEMDAARVGCCGKPMSCSWAQGHSGRGPWCFRGATGQACWRPWTCWPQ